MTKHKDSETDSPAAAAADDAQPADTTAEPQAQPDAVVADDEAGVPGVDSGGNYVGQSAGGDQGEDAGGGPGEPTIA